MKLRDLFAKWKLADLKVKTAFLEMNWEPQAADKDAAWELYVELLTRVTTQALPVDEGTEEAALKSIHTLFETTRKILKGHGRQCIAFSKVAVVVLNQVIRPVTSKWHRVFETKRLTAEQRIQFREDLNHLQEKLIAYSHMLADIADVEDITDLESV